MKDSKQEEPTNHYHLLDMQNRDSTIQFLERGNRSRIIYYSVDSKNSKFKDV